MAALHVLKMKYRRVHILGGTGSGKTFLGKAYSGSFNVPLYEADDIFWENVGERIKRSELPRQELLNSTIEANQWVIEGVFYKWVSPAFDKADIIIVLKINKWLRLYRMIKRSLMIFFKNPSNYKITFSNLFELIAFNNSYDGIHFKPMMEILKKYGNKVKVCNSYTEATLQLYM